MIETDRLVLRPPATEDLPWLLEAMNTIEVLRYLGNQVRSPDAVAEALADDIAAFASGGHRRWTVWHRELNVRIGRVGLFRIRSDNAPNELRGADEIGWTFAPAWWGMGYASEAARAIVAEFFADPARTVLWSQTSDSNQASTRMMTRLGFTRCPALEYVDPDYPEADNPTAVYRLARAKWQAL